MTDIPVSIVIPHQDRPEILTRSIEQVRSRWRCLEILVMDDGSVPDRVPKESALGPGVRVLADGEQRGPARRRNEAARIAQGDLLVFLDDDSWPMVGDLTPVVARFGQQKDLSAIGFRVILGENCESGGAFNAIVACGAAVRRDHFLAVGGFPAEIDFYAEEYGLCHRFLERGLAVRMWDTPAVFHQKAASKRDQRTILTNLARNNRRLLEPQLGADVDVDRRLNEILDWYELLGSRYGCADAVRAARIEDLAIRAPCTWTPATWREIVGDEPLNRLVSAILDLGVRRVSLWPVGKDTIRFADRLERRGVAVLGVMDPSNRYAANAIGSIPVHEDRHRDAQAVVVASFSPGVCWNAIAGTALPQCDRVIAGFGYVSADAAESQACQRVQRVGDEVRAMI